jgi:O-antigen/teichoic acid export membrane protein
LKVLKQLPIYFIGRIFPAAVAFFGISLYTHLLDPASFGTYALLLSISFLVGQTGFTWLRIAALRMLAAVSEKEEPDYLATIATGFFITALVVAGAVYAVVSIYNRALPPIVIVLTVASAVSSAWFEMNITVSQAKGKLVTLAMLQIGRSLAALGATLGLIHFGMKEVALLGGFVVGNMVGLGSTKLWISAFRGQFRSPILARLFLFGWPGSLAAINNVSATFIRYTLEITGSTAAVGIYSSAVDFTNQTISLLIGTASLAGQPLAFRARDQGTHDELIAQLRTNVRLIFTIGLGATVGLIALAGPISHVYFGAKFRAFGGSTIAEVITISALGVFLAGLRGSYFEQAFEIAFKTWPLVVIMVIRTATTLGVGFFMVRSFGILGAAMTVLGSDIISTIVSFAWGRRLIKMPLPFLSFAKTAVAAAIMVIGMLLIPNRDSLLGLTLAITTGLIVYGVALFVLFGRELVGASNFSARARGLLTRS